MIIMSSERPVLRQIDSSAATWQGSPAWEPEKMAVSRSVRPYFSSIPRAITGSAWIGLEAER